MLTVFLTYSDERRRIVYFTMWWNNWSKDLIFTYESQANDDQYWYYTDNPSNNVRPFRINVAAVLKRLVLDPIEEQNEKERRWRDHFPHPSPEKPPETTSRSDHLLHIVEKSVRTVDPRDQDTLAYSDQQHRPIRRVFVHQLQPVHASLEVQRKNGTFIEWNLAGFTLKCNLYVENSFKRLNLSF